MSDRFSMSVRFNSPVADVREAIAKALHAMDALSIAWSADRLHVSAKVKAGLWTLDPRLSIQIEETGKIRVHSEGGLTFFGNARNTNKNICRQFLAHLANQHKGQTLLRASAAPDQASDDLMRAVVSAPIVENELLRSSDEVSPSDSSKAFHPEQ